MVVFVKLLIFFKFLCNMGWTSDELHSLKFLLLGAQYTTPCLFCSVGHFICHYAFSYCIKFVWHFFCILAFNLNQTTSYILVQLLVFVAQVQTFLDDLFCFLHNCYSLLTFLLFINALIWVKSQHVSWLLSVPNYKRYLIELLLLFNYPSFIVSIMLYTFILLDILVSVIFICHWPRVALCALSWDCKPTWPMAFWSDATSKNGVVCEVKNSIAMMCMNYSPLEKLLMDQTWGCCEGSLRWTEIVCGNVIHWSSFWRTYQKINHMHLSSDGKVQM